MSIAIPVYSTTPDSKSPTGFVSVHVRPLSSDINNFESDVFDASVMKATPSGLCLPTTTPAIFPPIVFFNSQVKVSLLIKYKLLSANPELSVVVAQYPSTVLNKLVTVPPNGPFT